MHSMENEWKAILFFSHHRVSWYALQKEAKSNQDKTFFLAAEKN